MISYFYWLWRLNLLRIASDYFWANFVCSFLDKDGILFQESENFLHTQIDTKPITKIITIPDCILEPLFLFMLLIGAIHLNKSAVGVSGIHDILPDGTVSSLKRKRIIERLSRGLRLHLIPWSQSRNRLIS